MAVSGKSKKELIEEINTLRSRIKELEHNQVKYRKTEEKLRESEFQYRTTLDSMRDAIHVVDTDLNIILMNERFIDWLKELDIEVEQPVGSNIFDVFPFLPDKVRDEYHRVLDGGKILTTVETNRITGRDIFTESRKIPVLEGDKVVKVITIIRDVTEKKLAEDSIRESEEKFRSLAEQSPNMIFINKEGRIIYANKICEEITGYKREEFYAPDFNFLTLIAPQSRDLIKEKFSMHLNGQDVPPYEYIIINKAGNQIDVINSSKLIQYEGGTAILGVVTDITERKRQENITAIQRDLAIQLAAATELESGLLLCLEAAIEISGMDSGGIYLVDEDSGAFELAVHSKLSDMFVDHVSYYSKDSDNAALVMTGEPVYMEFEKLSIRLDPIEKREDLVAIAILPIHNEGRIIGCMNIGSHSFKQVPAQARLMLETIAAQIGSTVAHLKTVQALRESEVKYRSLITNIPDVVWTSDDKGRTTFISDNVQDIYGYNPEEIYHHGEELWFGRIHPDDVEKVKDSYKAVFVINKQLDIEYRVKRKDGQWMWIRDRSIGAYEKDGLKYADGVFTDITERKKAQVTLLHERDMAQKYLDVAGVMMMIIGEDRKVKLINQKGCEILGYGEDEIIGKDWFDNFLPEHIRDKVKIVEEKLRAGETRDIEYFENPVLTKDGEERIIAWHNSLLRDEDGRPTAVLCSGEDITERKRAEEAMKKSSIIIDTTTDAVVSTDIVGNITFWNKGAEKIYGYLKEEAVGKPISIIYKKEDQHILESMIADMLKGKDIPGIEVTCINKNQQDVEILLSLTSVRDEDGNIIELVGITKDITERKRLEEAYHSLVDNSIQGLAIVQDGRMVFLNKAFSSTTGYSEEELLAAPPEQLQSLVHPEDRELVWTRHQDRLTGKPVPPRYEFRFIRKDGSVAWVEIHASEIEYRGRPAIQSAYIDVTKRKRMEEALRVSEEKYYALFQQSAQPMLLCDLETLEMVEFNDSAHNNLGYTREEFEKLKISDYEVTDTPEEIEVHAKNIINNGSDIFETKHKTKSGEIKNILVNINVINLNDKLYSMAILTDITERKQAEKKFLEHRAQLKSLASELSLAEERERHRLATNLHDQISQALVISRIKLQALHASVPSADIAGSLDEVCDNLDRIIQNTRTLTFDLSSPILYELGFEAAVSEWLEEQIEKQHGIKTHFKDDGRPKPLQDDIQILLFRNVRELLINIVKHARAKNVKVSICRIRQQISISVEDDGIGFDHSELSSSSGFGIFSIRERLEQLAGHIEIESKPGRGSKITMTAPLKGDKISRGKKSKSRKK